MGFDLYGIHPKNPDNIQKPYYDWSKDHTEKETEEYFNEIDAFELAVPGNYFRANVWGWRPLWQFVCEFCSDFLSEKDMRAGDFNDGMKICKTKAKKIAARIRRLRRDGTLVKYSLIKTEIYELARKHNKIIQEELEEYQNYVTDQLNDKDIVPANYPKKYKDKWSRIYSKKDWNGSYPFHLENIVDFGKFCEESGGFEIC